jgi:DNA processing protein
MIPSLSLNTQAILLLTAPLMVGSSSPVGAVLSPKEYKSLAQKLLQLGRQPASLLEPGGDTLARECSTVVEPSRLHELLSRGFLLSQAVEQWRARSIWVISRADTDYPRRLKARMRSDAPPVLYGCGNLDLLETGGLAIVGPRKTQSSLIEYARNVGQLAAQAGMPVVSGGAKGIDDAAMHGVIGAGGYGCEVLAEDLFGAVIDRDRRSAIMSQQLLLISAYDPNSRFSVGHALQRNKLIYAMADAALVVDSDIGKGGTWAGAIEQIERLHYVPVFVRSTDEPSLGLRELMSQGAYEWPEPKDHDSLSKLFETLSDYASKGSKRVPRSDSLFADPEIAEQHQALDEGSVASGAGVTISPKTEAISNDDGSSTRPENLAVAPADVLFQTICSLLQEAKEEVLLEEEVAKMLDVMPEQALRWLKRLEVDGVLTYDEGGHFRVVSALKH